MKDTKDVPSKIDRQKQEQIDRYMKKRIWTGGHRPKSRSPRRQRFLIPTPDEILLMLDSVD